MGVTGLDFEPCCERAGRTSYDGIPIRVLALLDLIRNKHAMNRPQDRIHLDVLDRFPRTL